MPAFRWRLTAALSPILVAIAACADDTVSGLKGVVTLSQRGTNTIANVTRNTNVDSGFGSNMVRGGVTGVTTKPVEASTAPSAPPIYRATVNLTVNGEAPGRWHDNHILESDIDMVPLAADGITAFGRVTTNSRVDFSTLRRGTYHIIYNDHNRPSNPAEDSQGLQRLDLLGFFVTNSLDFNGNQATSKSLNLDLYWNTMAEPYSSDARTGNATALYTTYKDKFKTKPYRSVYLDSLPSNEQECLYRFVVKNTEGQGNVVWQSAWHALDPAVDPDYIVVAWNGYGSRSSGPNDAPPEDDPSNRLPDGLYFYSIEFYPQNTGKPPAGAFRSTTDRGLSFISTYYGASQWYGFQLKHGIKPNSSPAPGASPSPTPRPSATPTAQPGASPTPSQISL